MTLAAVVDRPGSARIVSTTKPVPADDEVLVRIEGCGVCASSVPLWEGRPWFTYPLEPGAPGHEAWGRLDDGSRVTVLTQRGFAEWATAGRDDVVELPRDLEELPFPGEALACAVNVVRRSDVHASHSVAVVGVGFLGSAVAQLIRSLGADIVEVRRGDDPPRHQFDRVVECAGTQSALDAASALIAPHGRLVIAGYHQDGLRTVDMQSWNWRGIDVVNAHERDPRAYVDAMREAVSLAARGVFDLERLVTHRFPLQRLADAFETARRRPRGFVKAWLAP